MNPYFFNQMFDPREMNMHHQPMNNNMYPEIYELVLPYIYQAIENLAGNYMLTDDQLNLLVDKIITDSKIMTNPPRRHSRETVHDIVKLILLMELDELGDAAVPAASFADFVPFFAFPYGYWLNPFWPGRRRRHRRGRFDGHNRGRGRY